MRIAAGLAVIALSLPACSPTEERIPIAKQDLAEGREVAVPAKVHLVDGSVVLCPGGFSFRRDTIRAMGYRYSLDRADSACGVWTIPLDSTAAMEYFERDVRGARAPGSFLLGASVTAVSVGAAVVLAKAIFGSCPTVYTLNGGRERLEAECFSYSIGRQFEVPDFDRLEPQDASGGRVTLRVKNEALETHYIDEFALCCIDHPAGTEAFPTDDGRIIVASRMIPAASAVAAGGRDILAAVRWRDGAAYACDSATASRLFAERRRDWIDCAVPVPRRATTATIAVSIRNSLENTVLLYDIMMRNQGLNVLEWSRDLNQSPWYAWQLARWYRETSGIQVLLWRNGGYAPCGRFGDTGPIAWHQAAARFPVFPDGDSLRVRLAFLPDNFSVDWIGFSFDTGPAPGLQQAPCIAAKDNRGSSREDAVAAVRRDDGAYFVTYPGESADLTFAIPPRADSGRSERTFFVRSKGYYVEWIRPEWVRERPDVPGFDLAQREVTAQRLAQLWLSKKGRFEDDFFRYKIPTADPGGSK